VKKEPATRIDISSPGGLSPDPELGPGKGRDVGTESGVGIAGFAALRTGSPRCICGSQSTGRECVCGMMVPPSMPEGYVFPPNMTRRPSAMPGGNTYVRK
jgi:hypothetical protein